MIWPLWSSILKKKNSGISYSHIFVVLYFLAKSSLLNLQKNVKEDLVSYEKQLHHIENTKPVELKKYLKTEESHIQKNTNL